MFLNAYGDAMNIDLTGRLALVTGASRGIGYFLSLELAKRGAHVIAVARTVGGLEELDDEIRKLGSSATLVPLDITDMEALDASAEPSMNAGASLIFWWPMPAYWARFRPLAMSRPKPSRRS